MRYLSNGEIQKYVSSLKVCGVGGIIFGAIILIASVLIMGAAMGRIESFWIVYEIPTYFIKTIAGLGMVLGLVLIIEGALITYIAVKIEGIKKRW